MSGKPDPKPVPKKKGTAKDNGGKIVKKARKYA